MYNKNYIMSKIGACYSIKTNNSDLIELDFYAQLNKSYLAFNFEILRAHNSVAWFLKERSALDSITLLSAQPLILKTEIPSPVDVQKNIGYGPATSGFHDTGEYIQNLAIGVGEPVGWVCSVAGTSGTWLVVGQQGVRVGTKANRPPQMPYFPATCTWIPQWRRQENQ